MLYAAVGRPIDPLRKVSESVKVSGKNILRFYFFCKLSLSALGRYWLREGQSILLDQSSILAGCCMRCS